MSTAERASRNIRRPAPLSLPSAAPFTSNDISSPESIPSPKRTNSPSPILPSTYFPVSSEQRSQHRRVMSTPTACSKLRITDKICPRKEKDKAAAASEPRSKPKPARTQPYGPPYNWIPPTPGAWAVAEAEEADEHQGTTARQRKRVSAPVEYVKSRSSREYTRHERERSEDMLIPNPAVQ